MTHRNDLLLLSAQLRSEVVAVIDQINEGVFDAQGELEAVGKIERHALMLSDSLGRRQRFLTLVLAMDALPAMRARMSAIHAISVANDLVLAVRRRAAARHAAGLCADQFERLEVGRRRI